MSVKWQMVYAPIPFLNLWASYRIGKLRKFLLLFLALVIGGNFVIGFLVPPFGNLLIFIIIYIPLTLHYMRKWSIQWNKKLNFKSDYIM